MLPVQGGPSALAAVDDARIGKGKWWRLEVDVELMVEILLMAEILHQFIGSLSHYL